MITIIIQQDERGCIRRCDAEGHSLLDNQGSDILCAAVTILLRTISRVLYVDKGVGFKGEAPESGKLGFMLKWIPEPQVNRMQGISDVLICGLKDLEAEYPDRLKLIIK
ncbi:MAG: ribosomal-processing cysteine protease Prp [Spirochaetales bacterium]|nr:ribosomal-processing cysteine protease Prp [Spirochaetales bacterium]